MTYRGTIIATEIRDPVYGFIPINPLEKEIIDHYAIQRLRRIKQLGLTDLVYPGALHSRFEHSLGVMHFVSLMFDSIVQKENNRKILREKLKYEDPGLDRIKQKLRLLALLHDVGHSPFSHSSEKNFPKNPITGKIYKHEDYTVEIIRALIKDILDNNEYNKRNFNIKAEEIISLLEKKEDIFWVSLISGEIDADRGDYLLRDSLHLGVKYGIYDHSRLLSSLTLGEDPESEDIILGVNEGGIQAAASLLIARYYLFTQVNFHKTRRAYDLHLKYALNEIVKEPLFHLPERIDEFLKLDDSNIWELIKKNQNNNEHCNSIVLRKHMRMLDETSECATEEEQNRIHNSISKLEKNNIRCFQDIIQKSWYEKEIMIISDSNLRKVTPLSQKCDIIKGFKSFKKMRIYVKLEDRDRGKEVVE